MQEPKAAVERELDSLLRGEIAAAETYKIAIDRMGDPAGEAELRAIQGDHGEEIRYLYARIVDRGVEPSKHSGPWGSFARLVESAATRIGDKTALRALREGEMRGLSAYQSALRDGALPYDVQMHVEETTVPRLQGHIDVLERMMEARSL
jgi:hypothetical protein